MSGRFLPKSRIFLGFWLALSSFGSQPLSAAGAAFRQAPASGGLRSIAAQSGASLNAASNSLQFPVANSNGPLDLGLPLNIPRVNEFTLAVAPELSAQSAAQPSAASASSPALPQGNFSARISGAHTVENRIPERQIGRPSPISSAAQRTFSSHAPATKSENTLSASGLPASKRLQDGLKFDANFFDGSKQRAGKEFAAPVAPAKNTGFENRRQNRLLPALAAGAAVLAMPSAALAHGAHAAGSAETAPYPALTLPAIVLGLLAFEGAAWLVKKAWTRWSATAFLFFNNSVERKSPEPALPIMAHHDHDHDHDHHEHDHGNQAGWRNMSLALGITAAYMAVEFWGAFIFNSLALKSDAVHMLWHSLALVLGAAGMAFAISHARAKTDGPSRGALWTATFNGALLGLMSLGILFDAVFRLMDPQFVGGLQVTLIGVGGLIVNAVSAWLLRGQQEHDANAEAMFWHNVGDMVGSLIAIAAGLAIIIHPMLAWLDPLLSILVSRWLLETAWMITFKNARLLRAQKS